MMYSYLEVQIASRTHKLWIRVGICTGYFLDVGGVLNASYISAEEAPSRKRAWFSQKNGYPQW